jgi:hypothetical protein
MPQGGRNPLVGAAMSRGWCGAWEKNEQGSAPAGRSKHRLRSGNKRRPVSGSLRGQQKEARSIAGPLRLAASALKLEETKGAERVDLTDVYLREGTLAQRSPRLLHRVPTVVITGANVREVDEKGVVRYAQQLLGKRAAVLAGRVRGPGAPRTRAGLGPASEVTYDLEVDILQEPLLLDSDIGRVMEVCAGGGFDRRKSLELDTWDGSVARVSWTTGIWPPLSNQSGNKGEVKFALDMYHGVMVSSFALRFPEARDAARAILGDAAGVLTACYLVKKRNHVRLRVEATSMPPISTTACCSYRETARVQTWGGFSALREGTVHVEYDIANNCVMDQSDTWTTIRGCFVRAWKLEQRPPVRRQRHRGRGKCRSGSERRRGRGPWCVIRVQPGGADAVALQPPLELEPSRRRKRLHRPSRERAVD